MSLSGFYLPAGDALRYYSQSAPLPYKIACEIAPVIEDLSRGIAMIWGSTLPRRRWPGRRLMGETVTQFNALTMALQGSGKSRRSIREFLLAARSQGEWSNPGPVGDGRRERAARSGEESRRGRAGSNRCSMPMTSMGIDVRANLPAAHALGRLAIGETSLPGIEGGAASQLASTRSPEFLPYLMMLGSPSPSTRDSR